MVGRATDELMSMVSIPTSQMGESGFGSNTPVIALTSFGRVALMGTLLGGMVT